ncbi:MAG: hypothetical protein Kow0042_05170 [Calditrichia bacterium]
MLYVRITLRTKLIIFSTAMVTLIMASVTYFFTLTEINSQRLAAETQIRRVAQNIATMQLLDRQDWTVYQNYISQLMAFNKDIVYIAIYDDRNTLRAHTLNTALIEIEQPVQNRLAQAAIVRQLDRGAISEESKDDLRTERVNIMVGDRVLGSVHVGFSFIDINRKLHNRIRLITILGISFFLLFSLFSVFVSRRLTHPLEKLSSAMEAVEAGDLNQQVNLKSQDEIAQLAGSFNEMVEGLRERKIIDTLGAELSSTFQLDHLVSLVRNRLKNAIGAEAVRLYIRSPNDDHLFMEVTADQNQHIFPMMEVKGPLKTYLIDQRRGFFVGDAPIHVQHTLQDTRATENCLVMPMLVKSELFGILFFGLPSQRESYTHKQKDFAFTLSGQVALALENAFLYEELKEKERLKRELEIAREIQQKLLPRHMPVLQSFEITGMCQPAQEVGGDYFDFFPIDDHHLGIVIADVCGKGTSASFYMAEIKGMMLQLSTAYLSPKNLLKEMNRKLFGTVDRKVFVTMIYGILEISRGRFTFARAGHNSLLQIRTNGDHQFYVPAGLALGLDSGNLFDSQLEEMSIEFHPGDLIVLYTDGITEAMNTAQEAYGEERLLLVSQELKHRPVKEIQDGIRKNLEEFLTGHSFQDDLTMVLIKHHNGSV